ncbi:hypothetical protein BHE74_00057462 [Ensete ventricosum]|nr:hypothetical protein BHE74_00057462 [Ensete ventricosum]
MTVPETLQRANQYVAAKALVAEKRVDQKRPQAESSWGPLPAFSRKRIERTEHAIPRLPNTPLKSARTEIFLQIWEKELLKAPNPMRTQGHDNGCYCRFHRDYGHDTEECYNLKNRIEDLIRQACIANARVKRIMIDIGSSTDILYLDTWEELNAQRRRASRLGSAQWVNSEAVTNFIVDIAMATNICVDIDEVVTRELHQRQCNYHSLTMSALTQMQSDM